jgi:GLPGLI family protein
MPLILNMKLLLYIVILPYLYIGNASGQVDTSYLKVSYNVIHLLDTTNHKAILNYPAILFIGQKSSFFESENKLYNDSIDVLIKEKMAGGNGSVLFSAIPPRRISSFESATIYKGFSKKEILEKVNIAFSSYIIEDTIKRINWNIIDSFANINGYKCQIASTIYKGRKWFAWFCKDIPVSNGPWKLGGLPGLIIQAYDAKNEVKFVFNSLIKDSRKIEIKAPQKGLTKIDRKEYLKLLHAYAEDPQKFLESQLGPQYKNFEGTFSNGILMSSPKLKAPNNPIEL